jgi:hypothetical protein
MAFRSVVATTGAPFLVATAQMLNVVGAFETVITSYEEERAVSF